MLTLPPHRAGCRQALAALGDETPLGFDVKARALDLRPAIPGTNPGWDDRLRNEHSSEAAR